MQTSLSPNVFLAECDPVYPDIPAQSVTSVSRTLASIWAAMDLDPENPFLPYLVPGQHVVIKPNWVTDTNFGGDGLDCLITHTSLISCIADWCAKALDGRGRITIGDCPLQGCNFETLLQKTRIREVIQQLRRSYSDLRVELQDWRLTVISRQARTGNECGFGPQKCIDYENGLKEHYVELDAEDCSFLEEIADYAKRFRVTMYKPSLMWEHHRPGVHQYLLRKEPLNADLLINLAKMKTHEKAGLTGAMKNLVGLNGHKEYLPHHIQGSYWSGGDCYARQNVFSGWADKLYDQWWELRSERSAFKCWFYSKGHAVLRSAARLTGGGRVSPGGWAGNETIWRTTLDLNQLVYFEPERPGRVLNVVDGIVAGEGEGPLRPSRKPAGIVLVGENPAYVDAAMARLMGFNVSRIPTVYHAIYHRRSRFGGTFLENAPVCVIDRKGRAKQGLWRDLQSLGFKPPRNWQRIIAST